MRFKQKHITLLLIVLVLSVTFLCLFTVLNAVEKEKKFSENDVNRNHLRSSRTKQIYESKLSRKHAASYQSGYYPSSEVFNNTVNSFLPQNLVRLKNDTTVVTAFFRLGTFRKGDTETFTPALYRTWFTVFSRIENSVVAYFDNEDDATIFRLIRENVPDHPTRIVMVARSQMWAFGLQSHIEEIFSQWWYPKHYPNTVNASYSCAMHAKYELMLRTAIENPHQSLHLAWLDIGLFRQLTSSGDNPAVQKDQRHFRLSLPPNFDRASIAYSEVERISSQLKSPREIIGYNAVWVCGCFFIGRVDRIFHWTLEYMSGVEKMLRLNWMSTDQQVLYWMKVTNQIRTQLQLYSESNRTGDYFYLGYLSAVVLKGKDTN